MDQEAFIQSYMSTFTQQQTRAVLQTEGAALLLAVPGSGKTTVLVTRLGYMQLVCGIPAGQMLTLTYTVAAARDMEQRYRQIFDPALQQDDLYLDVPEFRTINGICAKIIARYADRIGRNSFALLSNEKERIALIGQIYRELTDSFATEADLRQISTRITWIKNQMLKPQEIEKACEEDEYPTAAIYGEYCKRLRSRRLMDYDDQMIYALNILRQSPEMLSEIRSRYRYISVDEAQDTSKIQHVIIRLLAGQKGNLFMVGDEDQSIYGFRGACPEELLQFEKAFPGAQVLLMEDNFRSSQEIVAAANQLIGVNKMRHAKTMRASRGSGRPVRLVEIKGRGAQYTYLVKAAADIEPGKSMAVLFRDNENVIPLVDLFERTGIPYRLRGAELSFFTHRVVMDICHILEFALHPENTELFAEIYYKIGTYLTKQEAMGLVEDLQRAAMSDSSENLYGDMDVLSAGIKDRRLPIKKRENLRTMQVQMRLLRREKPGEALKRIMGSMGYGEYLNRLDLSDKKVRILRSVASRETSVETFLSRLEELRIMIRDHENDLRTPVIFSTIHASKGLEYDSVYMIDIEDGLFPESVPKQLNSASDEEKQTLEEERRIFYVGMTRAREELTLFGRRGKSTFIAEALGQMIIGRITPDGRESGASGSGHSAAGTLKYAGILGGTQKQKPKTLKQTVDPQAYQRFLESLNRGVMVSHKKFGSGVVEELQGEQIRIRFKDGIHKFNLRLLYENGLLKLET